MMRFAVACHRLPGCWRNVLGNIANISQQTERSTQCTSARGVSALTVPYSRMLTSPAYQAQAWQRLAQITSSQPYNQNGNKAWDCQFCISSSVASWKQTSADGWYQTDATTAVAAVVSFWIECTASCLWLATAARYRLGCSCSDCNQSHHLLPGSYSCTLALSPVRNASSTSIELCTQLHCG